MPNKNYVRGVRLERLAVNELEQDGYIAARTAGSHGVFDIHASNQRHVLLIQCKSYLPSKKEAKEIAKNALENTPICKHVIVQLWCRVDGKWKKLTLDPNKGTKNGAAKEQRSPDC